MKNKYITLGILLALAGCDNGIPLPKHGVETSPLQPRQGERVQINVDEAVSNDVCRALIEQYRSRGAPDGQISVHMPSAKLANQMAPRCVDNFDDTGIIFNEGLF